MPTVLLVMESEDQRIALVNDLTKDFTIFTCSPDEAHWELLQLKPDALVLDLFLPGTDGFSLLKECRSVLPSAVLLLTAFVSSYILDTAADLGVGFIVSKPFRLSCIREHLLDMIPSHPTTPRQNAASIQIHLQKLGISRRHSGYQYLCTAITQFNADPHQLLTKEIYPDIAKIFNTQPYAVERNIRTAIHQAWEQRNNTAWSRDFPYLTRRPTNKEFISVLSEYVE